MIPCHLISDLLYIRCHTRAYFRPEWDLQIFMELCDHSHLRGMRWDNDVFIIVSWSLVRASLEIFSQTHIFWHLVAIMLIILGDIHKCLGLIWIMEIAHLMMDDFMSPDFRPIVHFMPYWGIFPFCMRVIDLYGTVWLPPLTGCAPGRWPVAIFTMIPQWRLPGAIQLGLHFSALRCHHASPSEGYILDF